MPYREIEGTLEDVLAHTSELRGHRLRVTILEEVQVVPPAWEERVQALDAWVSKPFPQMPILSDADISRETLYAERV